MMYNGRRDFRAGRGILFLLLGSTALFALVTISLYRTNGWGWMSIAMAGITVIFGLAQTVTPVGELPDSGHLFRE